MSVKSVVLLIVVVAAIVGLSAALFGGIWANNGPSTAESPSGTTVVTLVKSGNTTVVLRSVVTPATRPAVVGVNYSAESPGLRVTAVISNSTVRAGGDLVVRVILEGEKASDVSIVHIEVLNSSGQRVYGLAVWIPHTTLTPINRNGPIWFDETLHIPGDVESGIYKVVVEAYTSSGKTSAEGTINVVK